MAKETKSVKPDIIAMALKKRHLYLLQRLQQKGSLRPGEIKELREFEGDQKQHGIVRTQEEVAKVFKKSIRTVQHWVKEGMPSTANGMYSIKDVENWRRLRQELKKNKNAQEKDADHWDAQWKEQKAKMAELELKKRLGQLLDKNEVEKGRVERILVVKRALLSLPNSIAPVIAGLEAREIQVILTDRIQEIIRKFSGQGKK